MKKVLFLVSLAVLCGSLAFAQDASTSGQAATSGSNGTSDANAVQGCLSGSDGNYMLTQDGTGTTYKLMGSETQLKKHVGQEVAITGQSASTGSSASAADQGQAQPSAGSSESPAIQVATVKMISKQCTSTGSAPQSR